MDPINVLNDCKLIFASEKQKSLFNEISKLESLTFTMEQNGIFVHIMGDFTVNNHTLYGNEDRLDLNNNKTHIHIEWSQVNFSEAYVMGGEGTIAFYNNKVLLFKLFNSSGPFPKSVTDLTGLFF